MLQEAKRRRSENKSLNVFCRKNKCFPAQFGNDVETQEAQETMELRRSVNNKVASEGGKEND